MFLILFSLRKSNFDSALKGSLLTQIEIFVLQKKTASNSLIARITENLSSNIRKNW